MGETRVFSRGSPWRVGARGSVLSSAGAEPSHAQGRGELVEQYGIEVVVTPMCVGARG